MTSISRLWKEEDGVLAFEWVLLLTLLVIGIVGGVTAARDAIIDELGDAAEAMLALDQTYTIEFPLWQQVHELTDISSGSNSAYNDAFAFTDCGRTTLAGQTSIDDGVNGA
jgi:Flp pilus assembly pilin Flp